ncbi:MAG: CapA family protein [Chloroflexi bacterium]|nr:CapA family protein [Chloroflexota bacterium]
MKLLIVGDLAITSESECCLEWDPPLADFPNEENRILLNWEFPVGTRLNPVARNSGNRYLSHPSATGVLKQWGPGFATLATNHMLDANPLGIDVTIRALQTAGFETVGAGSTLEEISSPLIWETDEGRLTIINWVFAETHPDWKTIPGVNCWPGLEEAATILHQIRPVTDWLILILHWSDELFAYPRPEDRAIAEALAGFGVDAIICHHPHVVRGMELFGTVPVFYSIGNFYFSDFYDPKTKAVEKHAPRNREGLGVQGAFKFGSKPTFQTVSFLQKDHHVVQDKHHQAVRRMTSVSKPLAKYSGLSYEKWYVSERNRFDRWEARWHFVIRRLGLGGLLRYGLQKIHPGK